MPDLSPSFVASVAQALNSAQVPCLLWGHHLLNLHGIPSIIGSIDFVIPPDHLSVSVRTLFNIENLSACSQGDLCSSGNERRYTPPQAFHIHVDNSDITINLFLQFETLWFLPPLDESLKSPRECKMPPYLVLASDHTVLPTKRPGRGSGVFPSTLHLVVVPRAHVFLEAFLRLYARDVGTRFGNFDMAMISYIEEYVDDDGLLNTNDLPRPLRAFYRELREGLKKPLRQWADELKNALAGDTGPCSIS